MESFIVSMLFNMDHSVIWVVFLKIRVWLFGLGFLLGFVVVI